MTPKQSQESQESSEQKEGQEKLTPEVMKRVDAYVQAARTWGDLEQGKTPSILDPKLQENVVEALQFIKEKIKEGKSDRQYTKKEQTIQFKKVDEFIKELKEKDAGEGHTAA